MSNGDGLLVALDAEVVPWRNGGVAHALVSLVSALSRLEDGDERYTLIVESDEAFTFWRSHLGPRLRIERNDVSRPKSLFAARTVADIRVVARSHAEVWRKRLRRWMLNLGPWPELPVSDGFYESLGCDVLHLTWQRFIVCALPTVYNPHDLQHLHMPQFWTPGDLTWRDTMYPAGCRLAQTIVVGSQYAKQDIVRHFGTHPSKIQVILEGADARALGESTEEVRRAVREKYHLPNVYLLYPAMTWPHKNHLRLLDAAALLRDEAHVKVSLVFTGSHRADHWPRVDARIRQLGLQDQVHALGFVPEGDLRAILQDATGLIQPSLFEASSLPIFDAWKEGVPVACSNTTALPEQVGEAGLLFDPMDVRAIANAMLTLVRQPETRDRLRRLGVARLARFDWVRAARSYRAVYRRVAGRTLSGEDRALLESGALDCATIEAR